MIGKRVIKMKKWLAISFLLLLLGVKAYAVESVPEPTFTEGKGTIVHIGNDEVLLVNRLDLKECELAKTHDEWLSPETINDIFRLSNVGDELKVGDQIRFKYAIMTNSIPPLVPVQSYELIKK